MCVCICVCVYIYIYIYIYKGTRQKCRNVGSFNCNFSVTFMKSLNQSSIKPCQIHECHTYIT